MSRAGGRRRLPPGADLSLEHAPGEPADTAPTPLFPKYDVPKAEKLQPREQKEVDRYRALRERFHDGPYYAVLHDASTSAEKNSTLRAQFDPFHGMPSYTERYRKRKRNVPYVLSRKYVVNFFPRELWHVIVPGFKQDSSADGGGAVRFTGMSHGFEDDDEDEVEEGISGKRRKGENDDEDEEPDDRKGHDDDGDGAEDDEEDGELQDVDFSEDDDEMGGDYNAEQYFDAGDDDGDGDGFADGGGGGDEDAY